ncbi:glutamine-dependent NAD(+) synthetase [Octopus bimaculoides]|uniref:Glutamine-dependent NAD(+) synthetase n=1 Tax=Octopus bimaculoides TaxID=37653 RepID=A0A0L8GSC2_OCTBM|nr:glutamine-dependent NAD(+) synthetase [Octopus bimaculoides]|eukprot:XP_014778403.1 PREDICTED: glutamine-dependent NAD(+) synthetase-like [Octopus bimaculoides]
MVRKVTLATCSLNQWAMDFSGNKTRIIESIRQAKQKGASYRVGPELEITGYSCADHFLEEDTFQHSLEVLSEIMTHSDCQKIVCDVGIPILHNNIAYNCRVIFYNKRILLIRPKQNMCNDGNYREMRWFTGWSKIRHCEDHVLPKFIQEICGQKTVPFGDCVLKFDDITIGFETCEELFGPQSPFNSLCQDSVDVIMNSSGSHHELRKANIRVQHIQSATRKGGGVYVYSNFLGCDGDRLYFDGCSSVTMNGKTLVQGPQFSVKDVVVLVATVDLDDVVSYRNQTKSFCLTATNHESFPQVQLPISFSTNMFAKTNEPIEWQYHTPEEEISLGPACWLWDYLRRSGMNGFFLPLSGGIDSSSVACIVHSMCRLVHEAVVNKDATVIEDLKRILNSDQIPDTPEALANQLLTTCYMGSSNSSTETQQRASDLAGQIGSYHLEISIQTIVDTILVVFIATMSVTPKFRKFGGTYRENQALQNVQARIRMVLAYLFAQLTLWARGKPGTLLVLGSANIDESLRGYMTKYDCSSADINPIGGINKTDLRKFVEYYMSHIQLLSLKKIADAPATAELEPLEDGKVAQTDEEDMGMTYQELSIFGNLRKKQRCGPYNMFVKLMSIWSGEEFGESFPEVVSDKVKHFFRSYSINRHKMTVLTPSYHAESYSPDDNRFDLRPFLYNVKWNWQFQKIDDAVKMIRHQNDSIKVV